MILKSLKRFLNDGFKKFLHDVIKKVSQWWNYNSSTVMVLKKIFDDDTKKVPQWGYLKGYKIPSFNVSN